MDLKLTSPAKIQLLPKLFGFLVAFFAASFSMSNDAYAQLGGFNNKPCKCKGIISANAQNPVEIFYANDVANGQNAGGIDADSQCLNGCTANVAANPIATNNAFSLATSAALKQACGGVNVKVYGRNGTSNYNGPNNVSKNGTGTWIPAVAWTAPTCPASFSLASAATSHNVPSTCVRYVDSTFTCPPGYHSKHPQYIDKCAIQVATGIAPHNLSQIIGSCNPNIYVWNNMLFNLVSGTRSCPSGSTLMPDGKCKFTVASIPGTPASAARCQAAP
jgi:hypothetical protein